MRRAFWSEGMMCIPWLWRRQHHPPRLQHPKHVDAAPPTTTPQQQGHVSSPPPPPNPKHPNFHHSWKLYENPIAPRALDHQGQAARKFMPHLGADPQFPLGSFSPSSVVELQQQPQEEAPVSCPPDSVFRRCFESSHDPPGGLHSSPLSGHRSPSQIIDQYLGLPRVAALDPASPPQHDPDLASSHSPSRNDGVGSPSVISNLHVELQRAHVRLEVAQKAARREMESILNGCGDEQEKLPSILKEKLKAALLLINEELEKEKEARENMQLENRMLSIHLTEAIKAAAKAEEQLEKERNTRKRMEGVCDELAMQIVQEKVEVEVFKRNHTRAKEDLEEELRMLQMADAWREERIQMKLLEARVEIEGRCIALDEARNEIATLVNAWKSNAEAQLPCDNYVSHAERLLRVVEETQERSCAPAWLPESARSHSSVHPYDDACASVDVEWSQDAA